MENDQNTLSQDRESIGVENLPLGKIKDGFKKVDTAYNLWRYERIDTLKAMEMAGISVFYFSQVVKFFEYFLSQENGGDLFPEPRIRQTIKDSGYYFTLSKKAEVKYSEMSQIQKEEFGVIVSFDLFMFLAKDGIKGIDRQKYDSEEEIKELKFEEGQIVKKVYPNKGTEMRYDHVEYVVLGMEGPLVLIKSFSSRNHKRVHPSMLKLSDRI